MADNTARPIQPWPVFEQAGHATCGMRIVGSDERVFELIYQPGVGGVTPWLELRFPDGSVQAFNFVDGVPLWSHTKQNNG